MTIETQINRARKKPPASLTPKQACFVQEYLTDLNATAAAIRAGYSPKTAGAQGEQLLKKAHVSAAISEAMVKRADETGRVALDVLRDIQEVTREARAAGDFRTTLRGLELEGRHLGMFDDRLRVTAEARVVVIREGLPDD
jgi:hypothetical protein